MKCLCIPIGCATLYSAKPKETEKRLFTEPILPTLGSEDVK